MALIPGGVVVGGFVAPTDSADNYPTFKPTYGLGGFRSVADTTERDAIPDLRREEGMVVTTNDDNKWYQLQGGIANGNWVEITFGGSTYTDEDAQDAVGGILDNGTVGNILFTYDDGTPTISANYTETDPDFNAWLIATPPLYSEVDPDSLHLDQTSPQSFTAGTVTGTGLLSVTAGELGLDTSAYIEAGDIDWATNVPLNETDPIYSGWIAGPPNVSEFTNDVGYLTSLDGALLLDQTSPQTFTGGTVTGSGLLKVTSGELGLDENVYLTEESDPVFDEWLGTPPNVSIFVNDVPYAEVVGNDTEVIFNDSGAFAGNSGFTFDKSIGLLTVIGKAIIGYTGGSDGLEVLEGSHLRIGDPITYPTTSMIKIGDGDYITISEDVDDHLNIYARAGITLGATTTQAITFIGDVTANVDGGGDDVTFYGVTSGKNWLWDASLDKMVVTGDAYISGGLEVIGHPILEGVTSTGATGTGNMVFNSSPTIAGHATIEGVTATGATGTNKFVFNTSPTLVTPNIGVASGTSLAATGLIKSSSASTGIGYATGAGGTVTQGTSKSTAVTMSPDPCVCGTITTHNAALASLARVTFTVTDSAVAATDNIILTHKSGGTTNAYATWIESVGAGSFTITLFNVSGGSLSEALVLNFAVIKSVTS